MRRAFWLGLVLAFPTAGLAAERTVSETHAEAIDSFQQLDPAAQQRLDHMLKAADHLRAVGNEAAAERLRERIAREAALEHIMKAVFHLESAGLMQDAAELRRQAERERADLAKALVLSSEDPAVAPCRLSTTVAPPRALWRPAGVSNNDSDPAPRAVSIPTAAPAPLPIMPSPAPQGLAVHPGPIPSVVTMYRSLPEKDAKQVLVRVRMMEVPWDKVRSLGLDQEKMTAKVGQSKELDQTLDALLKNGAARVLCEPTLITLSGQPAQFQMGGVTSVPAPEEGDKATKSVFCGTEMTVIPVVLPDRTLRLELRAKVSELVKPNVAEAEGVPGVRIHQVQTTVEARSGQTIVVSGLSNADSDREPADKTSQPGRTHDSQLLLVVRPEIVERK